MICTQTIIKFFHNLPRFNFHFEQTHPVNGFEQNYFQSLILWSCLPIFACILFLALLLLCWSSKCCRAKKVDMKSTNRSHWSGCLIFTISLCCFTLFAGLVANETANRGLSKASTIAKVYRNRIDNSMHKMQKINETLVDVVTVNLDQLRTGLLGMRSLQQKYLGAESWLFRVTEIEHEIVNASLSLDVASNVVNDFKQIFTKIETIEKYEFERRILFASLLSLTSAVMTSSITIVYSRSNRGLLLFSAAGLFIFIVCFCLIGATLSFNIVLSDVCTSPVAFVLPFLSGNSSREFLSQNFINNTSNFNQSSTYVGVTNSLIEELDNLQKSIEQVPPIINGVSCLLGQNAGETSSAIIKILSSCQHIQLNIYELLRELGAVLDIFSFKGAQMDLRDVNGNVCKNSILASAVLLGALLLFGFLLLLCLLMVNSVQRRCRPPDQRSSSIGRCGINGDDLYERGDPFLLQAPGLMTGGSGNDLDAIPTDFYGTHMSNPRTRQAYGAAVGDHSTTTVAEMSGAGIAWCTATPPPAYECVPLIRSTPVRQQRL